MSKRILSLVLALVMVLGTFGTVFAAAPSDVVGTEYETAVDRLIQLGALNGYPDGSFKPANTITRAEFAAAVVKTKGLLAAANAAQGLPTKFSDVPATSWASGFIGVASNQGLVNGVGYGQFDPESPVRYEEAVTMVMRALGYEEAAQARGGYPYGYLIVANETGLLDAVKGNQGLPASRGLVAQLLDNALEIPMMVQVGYGSQTTWVVSGTMNTPVKMILDELGFANVEGRVVSFDSSRNRITLDVAGKAQTLTVEEGFDFNYAEGLNIKAWYSNNKVIIFTALDEAMLDATAKGAKIKLVGENKSYVVAKDAYLELNGDDEVKAEDFEADYAKVVLNDESEIVWAKGYTLNGFLVVEEIKEKVAYDFGNEELDLAKYDVLKDGKTISIDDIEEEDLLFFNRANKFAVVYNNSKVGEIERVYSDSFRLDGKTYTIYGDAKYLEDETLAALTADSLDAMKAEEDDVELFFNLKGNVVLVKGNLGTVAKTSFYGLITNVQEYTGRKGEMLALDVRNAEGKVVSYDLAVDVDPTPANNDEVLDVLVSDIKAAEVLELTVDKDDALTAIKVLVKETGITGAFELKDSYVNGKKLQASTIIFYTASNKKVTNIADAKDFTKVTGSNVYADGSDRVVVVVAGVNTDTTDKAIVKTDLVTKVRRLTSGAYEFTFANGDRYVTNSKADVAGNYTNHVGNVVSLTIGETSGLVTFVNNALANHSGKTVTARSTGNRTVTVVGGVYGVDYSVVSGAKVYEKDGTAINLGDLAANDTITVYFDDANTTKFVNFVVRTAKAPVTPGSGSVSGDATIKTAFTTNTAADQNIYLMVKGNLKVYNLLKTALIEDSSGTPIANGTSIAANKVINFVLVEGTSDIAYIKVLN